MRAVVSTNALELGIDIGALDVCVMAGYPGTIAATWQRAGRAGRRSGRSAAVLVASSAPLDQFVVRNPSYFFDASPEHALINPDNLHILVDHVKCAAFELPFTTAEQYGRHDVQEVLACSRRAGWCIAPTMTASADGEGVWQWTNESYPADAVSLRSISSDNFVVVDTTRGADVIGETSFNSGPSTLHEKAIYLRRGRAVPGGEARLRGAQGVRAADRLRLLHRRDHLHEGDGAGDVRVAKSQAIAHSHGEVHVVVARRRLQEDQVLHERERRLGRARSARAADAHHGVLADGAARGDGGAAVCAATIAATASSASSFAMRQVAQLLLMCDRQDIGISIGSGEQGERYRPDRTGSRSRSSDEPRIFVYDNYPGGIGFSEPLFAHARRAAGAHARADRRVRVRARMPDVRRSGRRHRAAGEDGGAADSRSDHGSTSIRTSRLAPPRSRSRRLRRPIVSVAHRSPSRRARIECTTWLEPRRNGRRRLLDPDDATDDASETELQPARRDSRAAQLDRWPRPSAVNGTKRAGIDFWSSIASTRPATVTGVWLLPTSCLRWTAYGRIWISWRQWPRRVEGPNGSSGGRGLLFIDLETTGLAGGAGTYAFLVDAHGSTARCSACGSSSSPRSGPRRRCSRG